MRPTSDEKILAIVSIYFIVVWCIFLYKAWLSIQKKRKGITPGVAVGFLFIPFLNFFWVFKAVWGFAKDYNLYASEIGVQFRLKEWLFLTSCITFIIYLVVSFVTLPTVGSILFIIQSIIFIKVTWDICDAVNNLPSE